MHYCDDHNCFNSSHWGYNCIHLEKGIGSLKARLFPNLCCRSESDVQYENWHKDCLNGLSIKFITSNIQVGLLVSIGYVIHPNQTSYILIGLCLFL